MASNTCTDLIVHPVYQPYHLNATHFNISLGIALRNLANKIATSHILSASENPSSEQPTLVVQPLNVAPPSEATFVSQPQHDQPSELSIQMAATKNTATDVPSSSTQALQTCTPIQTTNVSSPPTLFLDYIILADVCESILQS